MQKGLWRDKQRERSRESATWGFPAEANLAYLIDSIHHHVKRSINKLGRHWIMHGLDKSSLHQMRLITFAAESQLTIAICSSLRDRPAHIKRRRRHERVIQYLSWWKFHKHQRRKCARWIIDKTQLRIVRLHVAVWFRPKKLQSTRHPLFTRCIFLSRLRQRCLGSDIKIWSVLEE